MILVSLFVPKFFIIKCFLKTHHIDGRETHVKKTSTHLGKNHTENPAKRNTLGCPHGGSGCWAGGRGVPARVAAWTESILKTAAGSPRGPRRGRKLAALSSDVLLLLHLDVKITRTEQTETKCSSDSRTHSPHVWLW